jgi:hypothetical protein
MFSCKFLKYLGARRYVLLLTPNLGYCTFPLHIFLACLKILNLCTVFYRPEATVAAGSITAPIIFTPPAGSGDIARARFYYLPAFEQLEIFLYEQYPATPLELREVQ